MTPLEYEKTRPALLTETYKSPARALVISGLVIFTLLTVSVTTLTSWDQGVREGLVGSGDLWRICSSLILIWVVSLKSYQLTKFYLFVKSNKLIGAQAPAWALKEGRGLVLLNNFYLRRRLNKRESQTAIVLGRGFQGTVGELIAASRELS